MQVWIVINTIMAGGFHSRAEVLGVFDNEEAAKEYLDNLAVGYDKPKVDGPHEVRDGRS
jgi:hypothetical protein